MVTELPSLSNMESKITIDTHSVPTDGVSGDMNCDIAGNLKSSNLNIELEHEIDHIHDAENNGQIGSFKESKNGFPTKNKRKRRRGKPKQKTQTKPFKKSNWRFQMPPRSRNGGDDSSGPGGGGGGGVGGVIHSAPGRRRVMRTKLTRSRSIVPYNTNKFLMEEHMAELPVHLTPPGRTRDSSFSVDSEDNYFYSLPEDEEEFLTKEFANVYERARVERLEGMTKQQLIEECLQLEDRYGQDGHGGGGITQNGATELMNKIRALEERVRDLVAENLDLRRQVEYSQGSLMLDQEQMCENSSEDSESDSSSTSSSSSSSCSSNKYSKSRHSSLSYDDNENNYMDNISRMDSDDFGSPQSCNGQYDVNSLVNNNEREFVLCDGDPLVGGYQQLTPNTATVSVDVGRVGSTASQPSSPLRSQKDINTVD